MFRPRNFCEIPPTCPNSLPLPKWELFRKGRGAPLPSASNWSRSSIAGASTTPSTTSARTWELRWGQVNSRKMGRSFARGMPGASMFAMALGGTILGSRFHPILRESWVTKSKSSWSIGTRNLPNENYCESSATRRNSIECSSFMLPSALFG